MSDEIVENWYALAQYDVDSAEVMFKGGRYPLCLMLIEWLDRSTTLVMTKHGQPNLQPLQEFSRAIDHCDLGHEAFVPANKSCSCT